MAGAGGGSGPPELDGGHGVRGPKDGGGGRLGCGASDPSVWSVGGLARGGSWWCPELALDGVVNLNSCTCSSLNLIKYGFCNTVRP